MSVRSHTATSEVALREAPSISEHQNALGEQIGDLRKRLNEYLSEDNRVRFARNEQGILHKE